MGVIDLKAAVADGEVIGRVGANPDGVSISGTELAYAYIDAAPDHGAFSLNGAANREDVDTGLEITFTKGTRPVYVSCYFGYSSSDTDSCGGGLAIVSGAIGAGIGTVYAQTRVIGPVATGGLRYTGKVSCGFRLNDAAGSYTFKCMAWREGGASNWTLNAAATNVAYITAVEI